VQSPTRRATPHRREAKREYSFGQFTVRSSTLRSKLLLRMGGTMTNNQANEQTQRIKKQKRQSTAAVHSGSVIANPPYAPAFWSAAARRCFANNSRSSYVPCRRLNRATSRAVSLSTARFFRSALLSRASLPCATPNSAFSFPLFQYNLRTTSAQPLTCVSP
jgi:hypothetical protein